MERKQIRTVFNKSWAIILVLSLVWGGAEAQWWNTSFDSCRNIEFTNTTTHTDREFQPFVINITGLDNKNTDNSDLRIINASCKNGGGEVLSTITDS